MAYVTVRTDVDVEIDLYDINTDDLIEELSDRGYVIFKEKDHKPLSEQAVWDLWLSWQHDKDEFFEKNLKKFFSEHLNINVQ